MNRSFTERIARAAIGIFAALLATSVSAHPGAHHAAASFSSGFVHPLFGWDHLLAMLAVGFWAAQQRHALKWVLPLLFPSMMAFGALMAFNGLAMPVAEAGIAASVLVLGLLVAFAVRMPVWAGAMVVSSFAVLHGYAHGIETPSGASIGLYGAGFLAATLLLHLTGLSAALIVRRGIAVRTAGAGFVAAGMYLLVGLA